jgi:hypothetical protein
MDENKKLIPLPFPLKNDFGSLIPFHKQSCFNNLNKPFPRPELTAEDQAIISKLVAGLLMKP